MKYEQKMKLKFAFVLLAITLVFIFGCTDYLTQSLILSKNFLERNNFYDIVLLDTENVGCNSCFIHIYTAKTKEGTLVDVKLITENGKIIQAIQNNEYDIIKKSNINETKKELDMVFCQKDRPNECDNIISPVCASDKKQYPNGCLSCKNKEVLYYIEGECKSEIVKAIEDLKSGKITEESKKLLIYSKVYGLI